MNSWYRKIFFSSLLIITVAVHSQNTDSTWKVYKNIKNHDTIRLEAINNVAWEILDKVCELVVETFTRSITEVKDGMDISLCVLNKKTNELKWAGASNPLWLIRSGALTELKPNKESIGVIDIPLPYKTEAVKLQTSDCIYIFTDGYADQFGGEAGKKFKYKQLENLLIDISGKPLDEQLEVLSQVFKDWKGNHEQVDDVLVMGVKI